MKVRNISLLVAGQSDKSVISRLPPTMEQMLRQLTRKACGFVKKASGKFSENSIVTTWTW
jgi:hypothetical protein